MWQASLSAGRGRISAVECVFGRDCVRRSGDRLTGLTARRAWGRIRAMAIRMRHAGVADGVGRIGRRGGGLELT